MKVLFIYSTAPDSATAEKIAHQLVATETAACVNILGTIHSIFRWEGAIEASHEVAMLVKTTKHLAKEVEYIIKGLHPYQTPAIVGWEVDEGSADFLQWIQTQVKQAPKS